MTLHLFEVLHGDGVLDDFGAVFGSCMGLNDGNNSLRPYEGCDVDSKVVDDVELPLTSLCLNCLL